LPYINLRPESRAEDSVTLQVPDEESPGDKRQFGTGPAGAVEHRRETDHAGSTDDCCEAHQSKVAAGSCSGRLTFKDTSPQCETARERPQYRSTRETVRTAEQSA